MRIDFKVVKPLPQEVIETITAELDPIWAAAASSFYAKHLALEAHGKNPPLGIQPYINEELEKHLLSNGWEGQNGRFVREQIWLRITFRHQMGTGSDFLDALLLAHREQMRALIIAAPSAEFARLVTPRDASSIATFEKLEDYFARAQELFQVPIAIGRLSATKLLDSRIERFIADRT